MGLYRRRHPERSDYYRLLESGFDEFARNWPEHFEARYGFLRKEVQSAVSSFLECGIPENGVARVRCAGCGHDLCGLFLPGPRSLSELHEQAFFIVRGKGPGNRSSPESSARHLDHPQVAAWLAASQPQTRQTAAAQRMAGLA